MHTPNVNIIETISIGKNHNTFHVIGTWYITMNINTSKNETIILNKLTPIFTINSTHLGKYTLVTVSLLLATNLTLTVTILLKKFHIESPINTNTGK